MSRCVTIFVIPQQHALGLVTDTVGRQGSPSVSSDSDAGRDLEMLPGKFAARSYGRHAISLVGFGLGGGGTEIIRWFQLYGTV